MSFITSPGVITPPLTAGGIAYGTGGQAKVNNAGVSGYILTSAGAGVPTWAAPPASGMNLVATYDSTGASSVNIENAFSTYDHYVIKGSNITCSANQLFLQTKVPIASSDNFRGRTGADFA